MILAFNQYFPEKTLLLTACTKVPGIGKKMAGQLLDRAGITKSIVIGKVNRSQLSNLKAIMEKSYVTSNLLRSKTLLSISRMKSISSYRGLRHSLGLPCRGQRTHSNARTCRRLKRNSSK